MTSVISVYNAHESFLLHAAQLQYSKWLVPTGSDNKQKCKK